MNETPWIPHPTKSLLDPRTKLLLVFVEAVLVLSDAGGSKLFWFRAVFALLPFFLLLSAKRYTPCVIGALLVGIMYACERFLFPVAHGVLTNVLLFIIVVINRFLPAYMMGSYVIDTTTVSQFKATMDKLHMPDALTIPMCVMFRLFPTIREENASIRAAMKMRGIGLRNGKLTKMVEYRIVPLITCVAKIGEELSAAALTRGLGRYKKRTNICKVGFNWADYAVFVLVLVAILYWLWCYVLCCYWL